MTTPHGDTTRHDTADGRLTPAALSDVLAEVYAVAGLDARDADLIKFTKNAVYRLRRDPVQRQPDLAGPVDGEVRGVDPGDLDLEVVISLLALSPFLFHAVVVRRWGDLEAVLGEHDADRLDTPPQPTAYLVLAAIGVLADEVHDHRDGRSISAAKKADAAFKMAFARFSSAFSRFNRRTSADSSDVIPARVPPSTSARRTHCRTVSGVVTPNKSATLIIAAHSDSCSARTSATIRTAPLL